ncbi:MAG: SPOR domain-containing protein [Candidatus Symbiothrix sp.]|jgi:cell division septation protein DedD|nr:SPOR domain-containing protein [Candidatus Symbiothrix sp.]
MKSKIYLFGLVVVLLFSLSACKSKQSAYKQVYEAAQSRSIAEDRTVPVEKTKPATTNTASGNFQREKLTSVDGNGIQRYSVVIGSFLNQTNAKSLKDRMQREGYSPVLAQNERGMYRVIVATFNDRSQAVAEREELKEKYAPDFSDAWLLEQDY